MKTRYTTTTGYNSCKDLNLLVGVVGATLFHSLHFAITSTRRSRPCDRPASFHTVAIGTGAGCSPCEKYRVKVASM